MQKKQGDNYKNTVNWIPMRWSKYLRNYCSDETDFLKNSGKLYFKKKSIFG
jgi:hypothetical protein